MSPRRDGVYALTKLAFVWLIWISPRDISHRRIPLIATLINNRCLLTERGEFRRGEIPTTRILMFLDLLYTYKQHTLAEYCTRSRADRGTLFPDEVA